MLYTSSRYMTKSIFCLFISHYMAKQHILYLSSLHHQTAHFVYFSSSSCTFPYGVFVHASSQISGHDVRSNLLKDSSMPPSQTIQYNLSWSASSAIHFSICHYLLQLHPPPTSHYMTKVRRLPLSYSCL